MCSGSQDASTHLQFFLQRWADFSLGYKVPHSRLSFGEELDEEEAEPDSTFNLAQSTADRCALLSFCFIVTLSTSKASDAAAQISQRAGAAAAFRKQSGITFLGFWSSGGCKWPSQEEPGTHHLWSRTGTRCSCKLNPSVLYSGLHSTLNLAAACNAVQCAEVDTTCFSSRG